VKKVRFLKNRIISLEDKVLELKKELALKESVHDSIRKDLKRYKKIVKGLEGIDPNILNLELENDRLKSNFNALLASSLSKSEKKFSDFQRCLHSLQYDPQACSLLLLNLRKILNKENIFSGMRKKIRS